MKFCSAFSSSRLYLCWVFIALSVELLLPCRGMQNGITGPITIDNLNWTTSTFETSLFNASVLANSTHAIFKLNFFVLLSELGWFSIGHGTRMSNSKMVIMWPSRQTSGDIAWKKSYRRASGHILPTLMPNSADDAIQIDAPTASPLGLLPSVTYSRRLALSKSDILERAAGQRLIWAMSSVSPRDAEGSLVLSFHDKGHGTALVDLSISTLPDGMPQIGLSNVVDLTRSKRHFSLITAHATILTVAWVLCAPTAIIMSQIRRRKGSRDWVRAHWILQTVNLSLTVVGVMCASIATGSGSHFDTFQKRTGFAVLLGMIVQSVGGYLVHRWANPSQIRRPLQNLAHIVCGCALVLTAWCTVGLGIKEWSSLGHGTPLSVSILIGITCSTAIALYFGTIARGTSYEGNK